MSYSDVNLVCFACKTHPALKTTQPCYVAISDKQPREHLQCVILIQFLYDLTRRQRTMSEHALTQPWCVMKANQWCHLAKSHCGTSDTWHAWRAGPDRLRLLFFHLFLFFSFYVLILRGNHLEFFIKLMQYAKCEHVKNPMHDELSSVVIYWTFCGVLWEQIPCGPGDNSHWTAGLGHLHTREAFDV